MEADQDYFVFFTTKRAVLQILKCGLWQIVEKNINCQGKKEKNRFLENLKGYEPLKHELICTKHIMYYGTL